MFTLMLFSAICLCISVACLVVNVRIFYKLNVDDDGF